MIYKHTVVDVSDNSGIKKAKCIRVFNKSKTSGTLGDKILFSIKKKKKVFPKKKLYFGLITQTKKKTFRKDGSFIKFSKNKIVTFDEKKKILGTRILGPISKEVVALQNNDVIFKKILALSKFKI